ncbi:MAG: type III secretion system export apparatus subunit SctR [Nitrospirae bacterium]|nr:type III secretion system export apparatus subunit SctR [Nitrospirota bacterium]
MDTYKLPDPFYLMVVLTLLSLAPFFAVMITSFIKITVVLSIVKNSLGLQQVPQTMVVNGLAVILTFYIMYPVADDMYEKARKVDTSDKSLATIERVFVECRGPLRDFLYKHAHTAEKHFFYKTTQLLWPKHKADQLKPDDLVVLIPAFSISELTEAFQIGFLLYLPFIAIDLIVSNILMAMGMMMLSPTTISLPFKLLLFVFLDGWSRIIHGLVMTYK